VSTSSRDEVRRFALLKAELLAAARAAIERLTDDQCEVIYVEIEQRLTSAVRDTPSVAAPVEERGVSVEERVVPVMDSSEETVSTADLPIAVIKRRAAEDIERDYLADLMKQAHGSVSIAARMADEDRTNFRRRLQRAGLRARGQMKPGPKYTDQILKILDEHKIGLRTYEIAERTGQTVPNAFRILKLLEKQERAVRHGKRTSTLWTLPGIVPEQRIETIQAVIVDVLSKGEVPMDRRVLEIQVDRFLRERGRKLKSTTLMSEIGRLIEKGVVAFHGANANGPMFALTVPVPEGESDLN
jgi:hypothetical protein